jgi:Fe-S oxidoreductase
MPPPKEGRIAVVGGGPSGLACALRMAARNYRVTLYEARGTVGGAPLGTPHGTAFRNEIDAAFGAVSVDFRLGALVEALDLTALGADAVYVATGKGGNDFGLLGGLDRGPLGTKRPGVFMGGGLAGPSGAPAVENGARAAHSIEKYLRTGAMDGTPETFAIRPINADHYRPLRPAPVGNCETRDGAVIEAARCAACECSECVDACPMLRESRRAPKKIAEEVTATLNKVEGQTRRVATRLMNACNQCGLCRVACPVGVSVGECLLAGRKALYADGGMPPAFHDFYLRDMGFALSADAAFLARPGEPVEDGDFNAPAGASGGVCRRLYFPGCQLGASSPDCVTRSHEFLLREDPSTGLLSACCGVPAEWAGDTGLRDRVLDGIRRTWEALGRPIMVFACMTCMRVFAEYLPEIGRVSVYELVDAAERAGMPAAEECTGTGGRAQKELCVYDPCSARACAAARLSVRSLLVRRGFRVKELGQGGETAACCGVGGHIRTSNPGLFERIVLERAGEDTAPYVAYCSNCRDAFAATGKACSHVLDEVFATGDGRRPAPSLALRDENRRALKSELAGRLGGAAPPDCGPPRPTLRINEGLRAKMERMLVSEADAREAVAWCEENDAKLLDAGTGRFIGHRRVGAVTCWVVYTPLPEDARDGAAFELVNVYCHRLRLREDA